MSSEPAGSGANDSLELCGMRLCYKMKWNIPVGKFKLGQNIEDGTVLARSRWLKIKDLDDLTFCLELIVNTRSYLQRDNQYTGKSYAIVIKQTSDPVRIPTEPDYAFVVLEKNLYALNAPATVRYLLNKELSVKALSEKETRIISNMQNIVVHCVIHISSNVNVVVNENGDGLLQNNLPQQRPTTSPEIEAYVFGGEIPEFTIDNAMQWIRQAGEFASSDLKILSEVYLQENVTKETVYEILDFAFQSGMADLHARCTNFIRYNMDDD